MEMKTNAAIHYSAAHPQLNLRRLTMTTELPKLPEELAIAQHAIQLPEVQEMMRKLSAYHLGVYMPHMHDEKTGVFQLLPEGVTQVEDNLRVSFQSVDPPERSCGMDLARWPYARS
jgi:hypothetical protein